LLRDASNITFFADVEQSIIRYDAIFVDEIQDYKTEWILIIKRYFLTLGGEFVLFGDEKQNVYNRALGEDKTPNTTITGRWNVLTDSFRSNTTITNLAFEFQDYFFSRKYDLNEIDIVEQPDLFKGTQYVSYVPLANDANTDQLFEVISEAVKQCEIHPNDVTVLSSRIAVLRQLDYLFRTKSHERTATTFESREEYELLGGELGQWHLDDLRRNRKFGFWPNTGTMKFSTIHSFKGWESYTLFLVIENDSLEKQVAGDETIADEFTSEELIYTAITRCRQNLIVINLGNEKYGRFFRKYMSVALRGAPA